MFCSQHPTVCCPHGDGNRHTQFEGGMGIQTQQRVIFLYGYLVGGLNPSEKYESQLG